MSITPKYSKTRGLIFLPPLVIYGALAAGLTILGLGVALKVQSYRLDSEKKAHATTRAEYQGFRAETERIGREAQAKVEAEKKRQAQINKESASSYEKRLAHINDAYRRLREQHTSSSSMPPIPDAPIVTADPASRDRLLEILRHADEQTARLVELQEWVKSQSR